MPRRLRLSTVRLPDITRPTSAVAISEQTLTAAGRLAPPPPRRRRPYAWLAAVLLHVLVIAGLLLLMRHRQTLDAQNQPGVSVVFDSGASTPSTAPPAPVNAPSAAAQAPPPTAPPPPQTSQTQPDVNLDLPMVPFAPLPPPSSLPQTPPRTVQRQAPRARPRQKYMVMNNMSLGSPSAPMPNAKPGLNLDLPQSDAQAANAPEISIHGDVGADWDAELNDWVNEHKYYPDAAAEQGQEGDVEIHFVVDRNGNVTGLRLLGSSGSPFLDQAWLGLFENNTLPPFPAGTKANTLSIDATMHFVLIK